MSKPTIVYGAMLILCIGGLWGILKSGSSLTAVADVSGQWRVMGGPLGPAPGGPDSLGESFSIEQSGRFLRIRFERGRVLDLKATQLPNGSFAQGPTPIEWTDGVMRLTGNIRPGGGTELWGGFTLASPRRTISFTAQRPDPAAVAARTPSPAIHNADDDSIGPEPPATTEPPARAGETPVPTKPTTAPVALRNP